MEVQYAVTTDALQGRWVYRYEVSTVVQRRVPRVMLNRYGLRIIGVALIAGRFAYCLKWAAA